MGGISSAAVITGDDSSSLGGVMMADGDDVDLGVDLNLDLDPVLTNFLIRTSMEAEEDGDRNEDENDDGTDEDDIYDDGSPSLSPSSPQSPPASLLDLGGIVTASRGLGAWRSALTRGRLPIASDFDFAAAPSYSSTGTETGTATAKIWPTEPLFSRLCGAMAEMGLPRFVLRHPETSSAVLLSLLRLTADFARRLRREEEQRRRSEVEELEEDDEDYEEEEDDDFDDEDIQREDPPREAPPDDGEIADLLADEVASDFVEEWGAAVGGVTSLDSLFGDVGVSDDLLDTNTNTNTVDGGKKGFGLDDGVWRHTGWRALSEVQRRLSSMVELRELVGRLGRRPTAEEGGENYRRFPPRRVRPEGGGPGPELDQFVRDSVRGLRLSGNPSEMLPSEAALLRGGRGRGGGDAEEGEDEDEDEDEGVTRRPSSSSSSSGAEFVPGAALRRLFLARLVESRLLSYDPSGWTDLPDTVPVKRPRYTTRMPSAPGGPIVVCLDTSGSMEGEREWLSKAVVLACVSAAHRQGGRDCIVVSFSTENKVMESGLLTADASGVRRLLDFLSMSFGGGTDVTGALKHAMVTMGGTTNGGGVDMSAADVLLVTDGEIPDPPVSDEVMDDLERLKSRTGMEVHGLLVGKSESKPLERLCTETHDFLTGYDLGTKLLMEGAAGRDGGGVHPGWSSSPGGEGRWSGGYYYSSLSSEPPPHRIIPRWLWRHRPFSSVHRVSSWPWRRSPPWGHRSDVCHRRGGIMRARRSSPSFSDEDGDYGRRSGRGGTRTRRVRGRKRRSDWEDEDDYEHLSWGEDQGSRGGVTDDDDGRGHDRAGGGRATSGPRAVASSVHDFNSRVEAAADEVRRSVSASLKAGPISAADELDREREAEGSCWRYRSELGAAIDRVGEGLVERDEESRLVVLAMASGEHVLLLGPPGTGKSVLGRRLSKLCGHGGVGGSNAGGGGRFFQRLLTRFTTPEEIFGPLSLRALENDEYRRCTDGFLPTADVAFLDEIFKANSAILNTLLTILNERQFDNGAGERERCPIRCVVGASNELPESDELDALYDRFLLRKEVLPVSDDGVVRMLSMPSPGVSPCDDDAVANGTADAATCDIVFSDGLDTLCRRLSVAADRVEMGDDVCILMRDLRTYMRDELDVDVSDRRLVKAARLLKVSAASNGRDRVDPVDCLLLRHVVWRLPEQAGAVRDWLWDHLTPGWSPPGSGSSAPGTGAQFRLLLDGIRREALIAVRKTGGDVTGATGAREEDVAVIGSLRSEAGRIASLLRQQLGDLARHSELLQRAPAEHLWLDPDEAKAAQQLLLPRAEAVTRDVESVLADACALEVVLGEERPSPPNELRLSVIELLWDDDDEGSGQMTFSSEELSVGMREAKGKYDADTFRMWKRARKKMKK